MNVDVCGCQVEESSTVVVTTERDGSLAEPEGGRVRGAQTLGGTGRQGQCKWWRAESIRVAGRLAAQEGEFQVTGGNALVWHLPFSGRIHHFDSQIITLAQCWEIGGSRKNFLLVR